MKRVVSVVIAALTLLALWTPASQAKPTRPSIDCGEGNGTELSVMVWWSDLRDGSGTSAIRRIKVDNQCSTYGLLWFDPEDGSGSIGTSLLLEPGASGVLTSTELQLLGWTGANFSALGSDVGADTANVMCSRWWNLTSAPAWVLQTDGTLAPFSGC